MRSRIHAGAWLVVALLGIVGTSRGDATPSRQSAVIWLKEPTLIVSTIVQGPVLFTHDADKMARGEPCTTVYLWLPGKGKDEEVISFHCTPTRRGQVGRFTVKTRPNLELGYGCVLTEFQFAGDTEGHAVPAAPRLTN